MAAEARELRERAYRLAGTPAVFGDTADPTVWIIKSHDGRLCTASMDVMDAGPEAFLTFTPIDHSWVGPNPQEATDAPTSP